jgi:Leu/Phe-tRNA-protein transferase
VNRSFDEVLAGINKQHGDNWFFKPIKEILRLLNVQHPTSPARSMTWELWEGDVLVAGEAGLVVGACYVSLSGFYTRDGAGTVQIAAMAKALESAGFGLLDFGQVSLSLCCTITIIAHGTCCFRCLFSLCIEPAFDIPI